MIKRMFSEAKKWMKDQFSGYKNKRQEKLEQDQKEDNIAEQAGERKGRRKSRGKIKNKMLRNRIKKKRDALNCKKSAKQITETRWLKRSAKHLQQYHMPLLRARLLIRNKMKIAGLA